MSDEPDVRVVPGLTGRFDQWLELLREQRWERVDGFLPDVPFPVWARFNTDEAGAWRVTGILIGEEGDGARLDARDVRKVSPARIEREVIERRSQLAADVREASISSMKDPRITAPLRPGPKAEPIDYEVWAERWKEAHREKPGREVQLLHERFHHGKSTLHTYLAEARRRRLIPPSTHKNAVKARQKRGMS